MITTKEILCQENINIDKGFFPEEMCLEDTLFFDIETTGLSPGNRKQPGISYRYHYKRQGRSFSCSPSVSGGGKHRK